MKEIGGYFELENLISNEYYKDLISLNTGKNALRYLIKARTIKKLYIPYYLCDSVIDLLKFNCFDFEYYKIDSDFMPIFNKILSNDEYLFVVNYYGQIDNEKVEYLKHKYHQIILDNTQAFFQKPFAHVDTIYTCRKFFGVPDGAYLSTDIRLDEVLDTDRSKDRMTHILGRFEGFASEYYSNFQNNEDILANEPIKYMSKLTHNILGAIDYVSVCQTRNRNYAYLEKELGIYNGLKTKVPQGAFAYPFYTKNGLEIRKELAKRKIYIPILWPNVLTDTPVDCIEYDYAANILPLPCDQRYSIDDMKSMINEIKDIK